MYEARSVAYTKPAEVQNVWVTDSKGLSPDPHVSSSSDFVSQLNMTLNPLSFFLLFFFLSLSLSLCVSLLYPSVCFASTWSFCISESSLFTLPRKHKNLRTQASIGIASLFCNRDHAFAKKPRNQWLSNSKKWKWKLHRNVFVEFVHVSAGANRYSASFAPACELFQVALIETVSRWNNTRKNRVTHRKLTCFSCKN